MKKIILIRHGSIEAKYAGCYIGSLDVPLSAGGLKEAGALGRYLATAEYGHIFASPLLRVRQTLEAALPAEKLAKVCYDDRLREIDFGLWEGKKFSRISKQYPEEVKNWAAAAADFSFPGGGNPAVFFRDIEFFKETLLASPAANIVVFSHGGVILALLCSILGLKRENMLAFKVERGSVSTLELFENGCGRLTGINIKPAR